MNSYNVQTLLDGPRNTVAKVDVSLDGSGDFLNPEIVLDPRTLSSYGPSMRDGPKARLLRVDLLDWDIQDGLMVNLLWEGVGSTRLWTMVGRSLEKAYHIGGLQNNADQPTGRIMFTTTSTQQIPLVATFKIHTVKQP
jgi:hypothetical protein